MENKSWLRVENRERDTEIEREKGSRASGDGVWSRLLPWQKVL